MPHNYDIIAIVESINNHTIWLSAIAEYYEDGPNQTRIVENVHYIGDQRLYVLVTRTSRVQNDETYVDYGMRVLCGAVEGFVTANTPAGRVPSTAEYTTPRADDTGGHAYYAAVVRRHEKRLGAAC